MCAVVELPIHGRVLGALNCRSAVHLQTPRFRRAGQLGKKQVGTLLGKPAFDL
jgi:hypothetical protein